MLISTSVSSSSCAPEIQRVCNHGTSLSNRVFNHDGVLLIISNRLIQSNGLIDCGSSSTTLLKPLSIGWTHHSIRCTMQFWRQKRFLEPA